MKILVIVIFLKNLFAMNGLELAKLLDERPKPNDIKSVNTMILTNKDNKKKTLELISISKDDSKKQMIWFLKPRKDKGISFLKIEKDNEDDFMTMWLPGFSRFRRIKSSQKSDSFMGSDLSFEDLTIILQVFADILILQVILKQKENLLNKLEELKAEFEPTRLEQEVSLLAQKADVDEELDRLNSHLQEVKRVLD